MGSPVTAAWMIVLVGVCAGVISGVLGIGSGTVLTAGALVGTLIGTGLAGRLPNRWLKKAFVVFLLIVAVRMLLSTMPRKKAPGTTGSAHHVNSLETKGDEHE